MHLPAPFGKYELLEQIGSGGMADVFLARSFGMAGFEKRLVLKRIKPEHARDPRFVSLFIHEAKVGVHLTHPNIVQVHELGKVGESWYIAMEHLHGRDLNKVVRALRARDDRMDPVDAVRIVAEVCRGLAFAHGAPDGGQRMALVHRDVSPHNIFVTFAGEVKLVDFGIARLLATSTTETADGDEPSQAPRRAGGKFAYMSPEQASGSTVDHRTDLFSAGIVLWELLVGERLFQGADPVDKLRRVQEAVIPHPRDRGVEVDDALWTVLSRALSLRPDDRYDSAATFEEDLRAWLYEHRATATRSALSSLLAALFPDSSRVNPAASDLQRLADDLRRLEREEATQTGTPTGGSDPVSRTPVEGALRAASDERKRVVVLVVDIDGFTGISLAAEPEVLFKRHLQMLRWLRRIVGSHGGRLQHVHDDQAYLFFGVPKTRVDDVARAMSCAAELQARIHELRDRGVPIHLAIGAHLGDVTLGHAGSRVRYMARGDTTRLARRLSEQADHGQILASDAVHRQAKAEWAFHRGPPLLGRGGRAPVSSFLLQGPQADATRGHQGPWLRRSDELDTLRQALTQVGEGKAATVLVRGEPGTGKSRLVSEVAAMARRRRIAVNMTQATPFGPPLSTLRSLVLGLLELDASATAAEVGAANDRLRELGLRGRDLDIAGTIAGKTSAPLDPGEVWATVSRLLGLLTGPEPMVLIVEDAQHLSGRELSHLDDLRHRLVDQPLLLLVTWTGPLPPRTDDVRIIELRALDPELQHRLVAGLLSSDEVDEAIHELVARTCEGNALYIREMLGFLRERGHIDVDAGRARLVGDAPPTLPGTLAGLLGARIDALGPASKGALQIAAVIGTRFTTDLLGDVVGLDDPVPIVEDLERAGLIRQTPARATWTFASEFVRQAALRGILGVQQRDYHRLVADAMERRLGDSDERWSEVLAEHCGLGGRRLDGARHAYAAGRRREAAHELEAARTCYRKGLSWIDMAEPTPDTWDARVQGEAMLRLRLGIVSLLLGDDRTGASALQLALDTAEEAGMPWLEVQAHRELGRHRLRTGELDVARAHLQQALALARLENDVGLRLDVRDALADLALAEGDVDSAVQSWEQEVQDCDDPGMGARARLGLARALQRAQREDDADPWLDEALAQARAAANPALEAEVVRSQGLLAMARGDTDAAVRRFRHALQVLEEAGDAVGVVRIHAEIGGAHMGRGDLTRAYVSFRRGRDLAEASGDEPAVVRGDLHLAFIDAWHGEEDAAVRLDDAIARARAVDDVESIATGLWLAGRLLDRDGHHERARSLLREAHELATRHHLGPLAAGIDRSLARSDAEPAD